jgi:hypothetical protein
VTSSLLLRITTSQLLNQRPGVAVRRHTTTDPVIRHMSDTEEAASSLLNFRGSLSRFTHTAGSPSSSLEARAASRIQQIHDTSSVDIDTSSLPISSKTNHVLLSCSPSKKRTAEADDQEQTPRKKMKRGYAPPEHYAHLKPLGDYLHEGLDGTYMHTYYWANSSLIALNSSFLWYQVSPLSFIQSGPA